MSNIDRFQVGVVGGGISAEEIRSVLSAHFGRAIPVLKINGHKDIDEKDENVITATAPTAEFTPKHQPSVPIQFVWCDGVLHPVDESHHIAFTGKYCEQIGAVLYVRGE